MLVFAVTAITIAVSFNFVKPYVSLVISPENRYYTPTLRVLVVAIGAAQGILALLLSNVVVVDWRVVVEAAITGAKTGGAAILLYHLVPGDIWGATPPAETAPAIAPTAPARQSVLVTPDSAKAASYAQEHIIYPDGHQA